MIPHIACIGRIQLQLRTTTTHTGLKRSISYDISNERRFMHLYATAVGGRFGYNVKNERFTKYPSSLRQHSALLIHPCSTWSTVVSEFTQNYTIWGASGYLLKTLHHDGLIPYWACMSLTNIIVRTSLIPIVIKAAHTSARLANVAPEVQFLVSSFMNDYKRLKDQGASTRERQFLFRVAWQTLRKIYQLHKVNPLDVFKVCICN